MAMMLALAVAVQMAAILLLRVFPKLLGEAIIKRVEHGYSLRLERIRSELSVAASKEVETAKAEIQASFAALRASVDFISSSQSELRSRIVAATESLWKAMVLTKVGFGAVTLIDDVLLPSEMQAYFADPSPSGIMEAVESFRDEKYVMDKMASLESLATEDFRLFVGDRLWLIFWANRVLYGRAALLLSVSFKKVKLQEWRQDRVLRDIVSSVISHERFDDAARMRFGGLRQLGGFLEAEFLKEAGRVLSGAKQFEAALSDVNSTLQLATEQTAKRRSEI